jgi:hypothetical protein
MEEGVGSMMQVVVVFVMMIGWYDSKGWRLLSSERLG